MRRENKGRTTTKQFLTDESWEYSTISTEMVVRKKEKSVYDLIEGSIRLTDCSNEITFGFDATSMDQYDRRIEKLDTLLEAIKDFRSRYVKARKIVEHNASVKEAYEQKRALKGASEEDDDE